MIRLKHMLSTVAAGALALAGTSSAVASVKTDGPAAPRLGSITQLAVPADRAAATEGDRPIQLAGNSSSNRSSNSSSNRNSNSSSNRSSNSSSNRSSNSSSNRSR